MSNVLLLRSPSEDAPDRYGALFSSSGYRPVSIPVLETVLTNLGLLETVVRNGPDAIGYTGVIITSQRGSLAWKTVVQNLLDSSPDAISVLSKSISRLTRTMKSNCSLGDWFKTPSYVVGQTTASVLREIEGILPEFGPMDIRGESSGTGEQLAYHIVEDITSQSPRKFLYLTGDKNRDTLPNILQEKGIELDPVQVYLTLGSSDFERRLSDILPLIHQAPSTWWIVYFAPSAAKLATPILRKHFALPESDLSPRRLGEIPRIAAIGPTTLKCLRDELGLHVDVVADKPTPEYLLSSISSFDRDR